MLAFFFCMLSRGSGKRSRSTDYTRSPPLVSPSQKSGSKREYKNCRGSLTSSGSTSSCLALCKSLNRRKGSGRTSQSKHGEGFSEMHFDRI